MGSSPIRAAQFEEALLAHPHLISPAHLAFADTSGKFRLDYPRHLQLLNAELHEVGFTPGSRLMVNMPYGHGKSTYVSHYFPAWMLLLFPDTQITLISFDEDLAAVFGSKVKDVVEKWGDKSGIYLRKDTKAKAEWKVDRREGGMLCRGLRGGVVGRPADLVIIDDMVKNAEEAISPAVMEAKWEFYKSVVLGRLRAHTSLVVVMTRWTKSDVCGKILDMAKRTGESWRVLKFKAIADVDDPLGRPQGAALWPEMYPLKNLEIVREEAGRWWSANYQQEPVDKEGAFFRPLEWPRYTKLSDDAWAIPDVIEGKRRIINRDDLLIGVSVDWALSDKKGSDYTAMIVFGVMFDGRVLILDVVNERLRIEACVPRLAEVCKRWRPSVAACEAQGFQSALAVECRRYPVIPEVQRMVPGSRSKAQRALPAMTLGENHRIFLPLWTQSDYDLAKVSGVKPWIESFTEQVGGFTGLGDDHDDIVDALAYACMLSSRTRSGITSIEDYGPCVLTPGKDLGSFA